MYTPSILSVQSNFAYVKTCLNFMAIRDISVVNINEYKIYGFFVVVVVVVVRLFLCLSYRFSPQNKKENTPFVLSPNYHTETRQIPFVIDLYLFFIIYEKLKFRRSS